MNRLYFHASFVPPTTDNTHEMLELLNLIIALTHIPQHSQSIRYRHFAENENEFTDRNVYSELSENGYHFYQLTGETSEIIVNLQNLIVLHDTREHMLSARHLVICYIVTDVSNIHFAFNHVGVSVTVVGTEITSLLPVFCEELDHFLTWPTEEDSHRIYRPEVEPQELYYLGHRHFHCLHTQVVSDAYGTIRYIGLNDAQQFGLLRQLGTDPIFPEELCLLADIIYPNRSPVLTSYRSAQLARRPLEERRTYRKFNYLIRKYRIRVEHAIADIKQISMLGHFGDSQWICFHPQCVCLGSGDVNPSVLFYENKCKPVDYPKT